MNAAAPFIVGPRRNIVILSPAPVQFRAVRLLPRCPGISRGNDRVEFIDNDRPEVTPEAGTLVSTSQGEVEKILMPVGSHLLRIMEKTGY